ncbi:MAG: tripartite tricarboxylate transporter substrate binding protein [Proteobacteria bacterium]|nr:tripartite tricarboxylate transporter substrate binding protein [Pseudomonadota bacterium]
MRFVKLFAVLLSALSIAGSNAAAQSNPSKTISLVVPFAPGGGHDSMARILAQQLTTELGQQVIVENKPGANGMLGADLVARAKPDGLTILFASPAEIVIAPTVYKSMRYDPFKDLMPVTLAGTTPIAIVANPSVGVHTLAELIAKAKSDKDGLAYGTPGEGSSQHLAGAWLSQITGAKLVHVPYKGAGPATNDVVAGHIPLAIVGMAPVLPFIKSGKLIAVAVTSHDRVMWAKDVPTVAEAPGLAGFEAWHWEGVMVPAGTPADVVKRLQAGFAAVLKMPAVRAQLQELGIDPVGSTTAEFTAFLAADRDRFAKMFGYTGLKPE